MTVKELIEFLQTQPQELTVLFCQYSETTMMETSQITIYTACPPRPDGWVQDKRPDKPTQDYLLFPGN